MNPTRTRVLKEIGLHFEYYRNFIKKKDLILDIGIGPGFATEYIVSNIDNISVLGLDIQNILQVDLPLRIYKGNRIPFKNKQFDISLLFYVLHHAKQPKQLFKEAVRVTKRQLIVIEEFELPEAKMVEELNREKEVLTSLGIPTGLYYHEIKQSGFEEMITKNCLFLKKKQKLDTRTKRLIEKYLYVLDVVPNQPQPVIV